MISCRDVSCGSVWAPASKEMMTRRAKMGGPTLQSGSGPSTPRRWRSRITAGLVALAGATLLPGPTACGPGDECTPGFDDGEQFRITILEDRDPETDCIFVTLEVGDSFILTGGRTSEDAGGCVTRMARPEVPEFASEILQSCEPRGFQLGMACEGDWSGCSVGMQMGVGTHISRSDQVIGDGILTFNWWGRGEVPEGCGGCTDQYTVRIERLGMAPG